MCVYDTDGNPVQGAAVTSDKETVTSAANGRASVRCFTGANTFTVSYDGTTVTRSADISAQNNIVEIRLDTSASINLIDGSVPVYFVKNMDNIRFTKAKYSEGVLTSVEYIDKKPPRGAGIIELPADGGEYKMFVWDEMKPLTEVYTNISQ